MDQNMTLYIADSALFIHGKGADGPDYITVPSVATEMKSVETRMRFELACEMGMRLEQPDPVFLQQIKDKSGDTGDLQELSGTDLDVLAKALEHKEDAVLLTDDYAVQNVASILDIEVSPVSQKKIKDKLVWGRKCTACKRKFDHGDICPVCGSALKKVRKQKLK
jgi:UPF0271 protein